MDDGSGRLVLFTGKTKEQTNKRTNHKEGKLIVDVPSNQNKW